MSHLWLPFTQMWHFDGGARTFVRGRGTMLEDARGRCVYDAVSSIWTTIHGHCHPRIVEAIARQAATLDHATLLGATNPVAEELAERLCALAGMDRAFFASDGASAVEAAIKMALQYWQNAGQPHRTRFVRLRDAYHGDTIGAMSLSDIALFKSRFGSVTFETQSYDATAPLGMDVAAVIVEPLVQAAAGMRLVPKKAYERLKDVEALIVCDEIATGFGRTGTMFAFEQTGLSPDIICVGKGLTGGTMALSATLVRQSVYDVFLGAPDEFVHFFHGHSYAGNPIACAAALASLALFEEEGTLERAQGIAARARANLEGLRQNPLVRDVRQAGTMIGVELRETLGRPAADALYDAGHFTRPIGDVIQFVPPLCSTDEEVDNFFEALGNVTLSLSKDAPNVTLSAVEGRSRCHPEPVEG
jgi:adenosylmethionine-8-amino-7-oxononanoate aminotransferase